MTSDSHFWLAGIPIRADALDWERIRGWQEAGEEACEDECADEEGGP